MGEKIKSPVDCPAVRRVFESDVAPIMSSLSKFCSENGIYGFRGTLMLIKALALVSTVLLLMSLGFSVLGTTPLLILKHRLPMDSRVIRQVFHYCYRLVAVLAIAASLGHALADRPALSVCTGGIALLALALHRWMLTRMDAVRPTMQDGDSQAIRRFRELHVAGIVLNFTQLAVVVWALTLIKL
jgi:hypothetical protein